MLLARVVGQVVATVKEPGLSNFKLLLCEAFDAASTESTESESFVAVDLVGAGFGDVVLVSSGSAARVPPVSAQAPVDSAIVAIVDSVNDNGSTTYSTS